MFNYNKKIIVNYRKGTSDDPYVNINESHIVNPDGKVILTEIPLEFNRVIATSADGERYYEIQEGIPKDNEYKVDYINKIVTFSPNNIGKQFNFDYVGIGQHYLPVDMIYTEENNGIVTETLKQLIDSTKQARDTANNAADNVNTKAKYAQQQGDYAKAQGDYAKRVGDENKTRWLTAVNTYANIATTYPNPQLGDTVQTIDDSKIYRWDGTQWVWIQQYANAITDAQNKIGNLSNLNTTDKDSLVDAINEIKQDQVSHSTDTESKITNINLNIIDMAVELETLKGATLNGVDANIFIETFTNLNDINLMNGVYDSVNKRLVV